MTRYHSCMNFDEDLSEEERTAAVRQQVLMDLLHAAEGDRSVHRRGTRSFTNDQMSDIVDFRREYFARSGRSETRRLTLEFAAPQGPWGAPSGHGSGTNSWGSVDATSYRVRGPNYLRDKAKVPSAESLAELVLVDLFETTEDIPCISQCAAADTVERLRRSGEQRRLLLINFRCNPVHLVLVYAVPDPEEGLSPAAGLLESLVDGSMSEERLKQRLKVIPRPLNMNRVLKWTLGGSPAIIGKQIPIELFRTERECEVSLNIVHSKSAQRILSVLKSSASSLDLELGVLLESQAEGELPEQLIGGFRVTHPDLETTRLVNPSGPVDVFRTPLPSGPADVFNTPLGSLS